jgi:hypothetical protein
MEKIFVLQRKKFGLLEVFLQIIFCNTFFRWIEKGEMRKGERRRCSPRESDAKHHSGAINLLLQTTRKIEKIGRS